MNGGRVEREGELYRLIIPPTTSPGGTSPRMIKAQIKEAKKLIGAEW